MQNSTFTHLEVADFNETDKRFMIFVVDNVGDNYTKRVGGLRVHFVSQTWQMPPFFSIFCPFRATICDDAAIRSMVCMKPTRARRKFTNSLLMTICQGFLTNWHVTWGRIRPRAMACGLERNVRGAWHGKNPLGMADFASVAVYILQAHTHNKLFVTTWCAVAWFTWFTWFRVVAS